MIWDSSEVWHFCVPSSQYMVCSRTVQLFPLVCGFGRPLNILTNNRTKFILQLLRSHCIQAALELWTFQPNFPYCTCLNFSKCQSLVGSVKIYSICGFWNVRKTLVGAWWTSFLDTFSKMFDRWNSCIVWPLSSLESQLDSWLPAEVLLGIIWTQWAKGSGLKGGILYTRFTFLFGP